MLIIAKFAFLLLLFLLFFLCFRYFLQVAVKKKTARLRLSYRKKSAWGSRMAEWLQRYNRLYRHLGDLVETARFPLSIGFFLTVSTILFLGGIVGGVLLFSNGKGVLSLSLIMAASPYLLLRLKLISLHLKTRLEFLPAVEVFYQYYILSSHKNIRNVLRESLAEGRIQYPLKPAFEQLHRNLSAGRELDDCMRIFKLSQGHLWVDYFSGIIRVGIVEGVDVGENLKDLIHDMRKAQLQDQADRNRLLEIRLANFSPLLFLAVFLGVNYRVNPDSAYQYYVLSAEGRNMLLDSLLMMFLSFVMGVYLSMRRM